MDKKSKPKAGRPKSQEIKDSKFLFKTTKSIDRDFEEGAQKEGKNKTQYLEFLIKRRRQEQYNKEEGVLNLKVPLETIAILDKKCKELSDWTENAYGKGTSSRRGPDNMAEIYLRSLANLPNAVVLFHHSMHSWNLPIKMNITQNSISPGYTPPPEHSKQDELNYLTKEAKTIPLLIQMAEEHEEAILNLQQKLSEINSLLRETLENRVNEIDKTINQLKPHELCYLREPFEKKETKKDEANP